MEPVLSDGSQNDDKKIAEDEAQMKARKTRWYEELFQQLGLQLQDTTFHKRSNQLLTDVVVYVLRAGPVK